MDFTVEEMNFLCIVRGIDREDTINNIFETIPDTNDEDMKSIAERLIGKLDGISDDEYRSISFNEAFEY